MNNDNNEKNINTTESLGNIDTLGSIVRNLGRKPIERNSKYTEFYPIAQGIELPSK